VIRNSASFCIALVLLVLVFAPVTATQIEYVSPKQMGSESSLVVRGKVTTTRCFWNEGNTKILTETVIQVDETYKGQSDASVSVLQLGGVVGTVRMHVHGALTWSPGEEVLLFLEPLDGGQHRVAGFSQGKFKVERDPVTGEPFVTRPALDGAEVLGAPGQGSGPQTQQAEKVPLDAFVRDALETK
jgi:hypothetical protein